MSGPPAVSGTYIERMHESIRFSETNRVQVAVQTALLRDKSIRQLQRDHRRRENPEPTQVDIDVATDTACNNSSKWKNAVNDEQWGVRLATMYALAELVASQREANSIARQQLIAQDETNALLRKLIHHSIGSIESPIVPHQRSGT